MHAPAAWLTLCTCTLVQVLAAALLLCSSLQGALVANYPWDGTADKSTRCASWPACLGCQNDLCYQLDGLRQQRLLGITPGPVCLANASCCRRQLQPCTCVRVLARQVRKVPG